MEANEVKYRFFKESAQAELVYTIVPIDSSLIYQKNTSFINEVVGA